MSRLASAQGCSCLLWAMVNLLYSFSFLLGNKFSLFVLHNATSGIQAETRAVFWVGAASLDG